MYKTSLMLLYKKTTFKVYNCKTIDVLERMTLICTDFYP